MNELINLAKKKNIILEINKTHSKRSEINILNGVEKSFETCDIATYVIKAIKDNCCVLLKTENINNPEAIIENIENIFNIQENKNQNRLCEGHIINEISSRQEIDFNLVKQDLLSLEELRKDFPIKTIDLSYDYYEDSEEIINETAYLKNECLFHQFAISIAFTINNQTKVMDKYYYSKEYDFLGFKKEILNKLNTVINSLETTSITTNKYKVLLNKEVVANLLKTFSTMFSAKGIYLKESLLTDKLNSKVFSDKITIMEEPQSDDYIIKRYFDSEGTKTSSKDLIKDGVFVHQVNSIEYALKLNELPTGNASGFTNLILKPGNTSYENLVKQLDNGIIISKVYGLHCGIDKKTGDISLQAEGFFVQNGNITKNLNMIILSTTLFEVLNNVILVGNDLSKDKLDVFAPSLLLDNITIAGEGEN